MSNRHPGKSLPWARCLGERILLLLCAMALLGFPAAGAVAAAPAVAAERLLLRLSAPAVAQAGLLARGAVLASAATYAETLAAQQDKAVREVEDALPGTVVERRYLYLWNGLAVRLPQGQDAESAARRLRRLPGVSDVSPETEYVGALYASVPAINAPALWQTLGGVGNAGAGVKIALLDSGIDRTHPMLAPAGLPYPAGYPKGNVAETTAKIITARAYFRPGDPPVAGEGSPTSGSSGSGHGTHLAGVAAGNPISATFSGVTVGLVGVAPRSWLMNYRVLYPSQSGGPERASTAEILAAIEDAVLDGADVICLGFSGLSPRSPVVAPEAEALQNAMASGCVVVAPAGNQGPAYGSASLLPGGIARVITAGSVSKGEAIRQDTLDAAAPSPVDDTLQAIPFARALFGPQLASTLGPMPYIDVSVEDPAHSTLACGALPAGSMAGRIALVERGNCNFADKVYNAQQAGAVATVIVNDVEAVEPFACAGDHCGGDVTIPAVMISRSAGNGLRAWLALHPDATLRIEARARRVPVVPGIVAVESGRGPAYAVTLKPDLVAPGSEVLSSYHAQGAPTYAQVTGTSVACAHTAGAAALLLQAHPNWGHDEIKAALMASAREQNLYATGDRALVAGPLDRGAGLIDVAQASAAPLLLQPPAVSVAQLRPGERQNVTVALRDPRNSGPARTWTSSVTVNGGATVLLPAPVTLGPGAIASVTFSIIADATAAPGDATADLVLTSGAQRAHLPLWVHLTPPLLTADVLLIDNDFSEFESFRDYAPIVTAALNDAGISYTVWNADLLFGQEQTIPGVATLQRYRAVIWLTGDNIHPYGFYVPATPLTPVDQQLLASYLEAGGRLLALGQNLAEASDTNADSDPTWGRSQLYSRYLGAHWLQTNVFDQSDSGGQPPSSGAGIVGWPGSFLQGMAFDLGDVGSGAHNQTSIDEVAPGGLRDASDVDLSQPLLLAVDGEPLGEGIVALARYDDATLDDASVDLPYRSAYLAFGLEGINDNPGMTTAGELLGRTLPWLWDRLTVSLPDRFGAPSEGLLLQAQASSSDGEVVSYRWRIDRGEGPQVLISNSPAITVFYPRVGAFHVTVEATDSLGHTAIDDAVVTISPAGHSTFTVSRPVARPGDVLRYQIHAENSTSQLLTLSFALAVPAGTRYLAHSGGSFSNGVVGFSGTLSPGAVVQATLDVQIASDASLLGSTIVATAGFQVSGQSFTQTASTDVRQLLMLPLVWAP